MRLCLLTVMLLGLLAFAGSGAGQTAWITPTTAEVDAIYPDIEALYIDLHRNPELAFQEVQTAAKLAALVKALGYEVTTGVGQNRHCGSDEKRTRTHGDVADRTRRPAGGRENRSAVRQQSRGEKRQRPDRLQ